jgi:hypothetical protein
MPFSKNVSAANKKPRSLPINDYAVSILLCKHRKQVETWEKLALFGFPKNKRLHKRSLAEQRF